MTPDAPDTVVLCINDAPLRRRVADCLEQSGACVQLVDQDGTVAADIIVSDHQVEISAAGGRIRLGTSAMSDGECDAVLSADFLDRELVALVRLVGQLARLRRQLAAGDASRRVLRDQALTDSVTGLANRRGWDEAVEQTLADCRHRGVGLTVAVIDLDHFKRINDTRGHATGDEVLRHIGQQLAASLREGDTLARLGGDEFAIALPGLTDEHAQSVVDRIRMSVRGVDVTEILTASAGYTSASADSTTNVLLESADRAMYAAKKAGRDCTRRG